MNEKKQLHSGWLKTRDNEKFAPKTLISDIFTNTGDLYIDEAEQALENLHQRINDLDYSKSGQANQTITLVTQADGLVNVNYADIQLDNLNTADDDTLFIVDKLNNVIAYIDAEGVHTVDANIERNLFVSENAMIGQGLSAKDAIIENLTVLNNETVGNNFSVAGNTSVSGNLNVTDTAILQSGIDFANADTFYIIDSQNNVIAFCNQDGLTVTEMATENINAINSEAFYIVDKNNNVVCYIDKDGIHTTNIEVLNKNLIFFTDYSSVITINF